MKFTAATYTRGAAFSWLPCKRTEPVGLSGQASAHPYALDQGHQRVPNHTPRGVT